MAAKLTVNAELHDATIGHQVDLQQYGNGVVQRIIALLNRTDADLFARLSAALEQMDPASFTVERLDSLLQSVRALNVQAYQEVGRELNTVLREFAAYEAGWQQQLFTSTIPPQVQATIGVASVNAEQVYAAAMARPFQGRLLREWSAGIEANRMARVRDAVRMGFVQQESIGQIVQRIRGTRANGYADGLLEIDRREAQAVVRTAISHVAGVARDAVLEANAGLVAAVQWVSTLDTRTSELCRPRDGLKYGTTDHKPIGHKVPWLAGPGRLHWGCRSCSAPVVKSWRDLGLNIDSIDPATRASMDGQVPEATSYGDWLARQSAQRQDQVLGPTRGALLRQGGLKPGDFYNDKGRFLSLEQLRERDAAAFRKAGL